MDHPRIKVKHGLRTWVRWTSALSPSTSSASVGLRVTPNGDAHSTDVTPTFRATSSSSGTFVIRFVCLARCASTSPLPGCQRRPQVVLAESRSSSSKRYECGSDSSDDTSSLIAISSRSCWYAGWPVRNSFASPATSTSGPAKSCVTRRSTLFNDTFSWLPTTT